MRQTERALLKVTDPIEHADPAAQRFEQLFDRFYAEILGLTYRLLGDRAEAEDIAQEAFYRLSVAEVQRRPADEVGAWLRRVCLNLGTNRLRDARRARERMERAGRLELVLTVSEQEGPIRSLLRREEQERVRESLAELPDRQRDCLLLRHSGYSYTEIAETLGVAVGSVGVLLARAERAFRDLFEERNHDLS
jgi:RNA polymerase sigma factor (sigma-70 family)